MNVNAGIFAFYLIGYNLRHSQIWLSYPRWLSYILISPAQHQIHHSIDKKHWDRNMGLIFAFWDWVFGTLYVPKGYEKLEYGISRDEPNPFNSVVEIYLKPFRMAYDLMRPAAPRRLALIGLIAVGTLGAVLFNTPGHSANRALPSLHLEELTWTEVAAALDAGMTTVMAYPRAELSKTGRTSFWANTTTSCAPRRVRLPRVWAAHSSHPSWPMFPRATRGQIHPDI